MISEETVRIKVLYRYCRRYDDACTIRADDAKPMTSILIDNDKDANKTEDAASKHKTGCARRVLPTPAGSSWATSTMSMTPATRQGQRIPLQHRRRDDQGHHRRQMTDGHRRDVDQVGRRKTNSRASSHCQKHDGAGAQNACPVKRDKLPKTKGADLAAAAALFLRHHLLAKTLTVSSPIWTPGSRLRCRLVCQCSSSTSNAPAQSTWNCDPRCRPSTSVS